MGYLSSWQGLYTEVVEKLGNYCSSFPLWGLDHPVGIYLTAAGCLDIFFWLIVVSYG